MESGLDLNSIMVVMIAIFIIGGGGIVIASVLQQREVDIRSIYHCIEHDLYCWSYIKFWPIRNSIWLSWGPSLDFWVLIVPFVWFFGIYILYL